jgi:hypothetical protein
MVQLRHHPIQITCPTTGELIWVSKSVRDDPVAALFITGRISRHQYDAAGAYQEDVAALSGRLRAANRPDDTAWRPRRSDDPRLAKHRKRIERAHSLLGPDRTRLIKSVLVDGSSPGADLREYALALDQLAVAYGLATPTRH